MIRLKKGQMWQIPFVQIGGLRLSGKEEVLSKLQTFEIVIDILNNNHERSFIFQEKNKE